MSILFVALLWVVGQEVATVDKPVVSTVTSYRVVAFSQERYPEWRFTIKYQDSNGNVYTDEHVGLTTIPNPAGGTMTNASGADAFLKQMNTANFTTTSMVKRLLEHLETHGKIPASTVTGTPEK